MRKIAVFLLSVITLIALSMPVYAAGKPGSVYIEVAVDEDIKISSADSFIITYAQDGSEDTKTLEIVASELNGQVATFELPEGTYVIYDCQYGGDNVDILEGGYAITSVFEVGETAVNQIRLAVGFSTGMRLINEEADYLAYQNGEVVETLDPQPVNDDPDLYNGDGTGVKKQRPESSETVSDDTSKPSGNADDYAQSDLVERENKKEASSSIWLKLLLLAIIAVVGTVVILIIKKKNKL